MSNDDQWHGDPCICGDKETWHPACYARIKLDPEIDVSIFNRRRILSVIEESNAELRMEVEKLHTAMAGLQDLEAAALDRVHSFETMVRRMMAAEMAKDHKEWLALHHDLYALMKSPNV